MPDDATQELIDGLNEDLAHELQAVIFYAEAAQKMTGANRPALKGFFESEIQDELGHAQFLAGKIVALGGEPVTEPKPVELGSSNRERIEIALQAEIDTIERYKQRAKQAEAVGEQGLVVHIEDLVADESDHRDDMRMILEDFDG
jgi:bacterioferritin